MKRYLFFLVIFLLPWVQPAWAHKISIFAYVEGQTIQGQVYFNDGSPAKKAKVTLLPAKGDKVLAETQTDAEGNFKLPLPKGVKGTVRVVALAEMGHRAEMKLALKEEAPQTPGFPEGFSPAPEPVQTQAAPVTTGLSEKELQQIIDRELEKQLAPIRQILEDLVKQLQKPSFSEIFGGIGYIFGFFGIIAWAYSKRK